MKKIILILLSILTLSTTAFANGSDECNLGESCDFYNNDIILPPPYIGTYTCVLSTGNYENVAVEVALLTKNTISEPASLVLSNDKKSGEIKVMKHPNSPPGANLENSFRVTPTSVPYCDETSGKICNSNEINIACQQTE